MKSALLSALIASACISGSVFAQDVVPEPDANLMIWADHGVSTQFMRYAAKQFDQHNHYHVKFSFRSLSPVDTATRLIQDGGTTKVGDVVEIEHDTLGRLVVAGGVMENLVSAKRIEDNFISSASAAAKIDGKSYGFPLSFSTVVMFYNKDLLPKAPATFEQLIKFAKKFNNPDKHKYTLLWNIQNYYQSRMFLAMEGGYEFGNNGTNAKDLGIANKGAVAGLTSMLKLKAANSANSADISDPQVRRALFEEGKVAAIIDGPWAVKAFKSAGLNYGVAPIPTLDGHHPRTFATVRLAVVSAFTQYPRAAELFANFISSKEMAKKRFEMTGSVPVIKSVMKEAASDTNAEPITHAMIEQGAYSDAMPSIPEMGYLWQPMDAALSGIWNGNENIKGALDKAENIIQQQISMQQ
ncbi:maltose ABC transporter substrate-binding protein [Vibrio profundum]|uniref:sugar ABC transporter substrate-binding protein n=1 Tax=Vibrio profundum TaxID=2910247 RepID=UPI003D0EAAA4